MFATSRTDQAPAARRQPRGDRLHPAAAGGGVHRQHPVGEGAAGRHAPPAAARIHARQFHRHPHQGRAEGPHLRAGHLPARQHQELLHRLRQLDDRGDLGHLPDPAVRLAVGLHHRPPALPMDAVPAAGQHRRALRAGDRADDPALRRHALVGPAQLAERRHHRRDRLPAALRHPDPGALFRHHPGRARGGRAHRRLHALRRLRAASSCRWRRRRWRPAASSCSSSPGTSF